MTFRKAIIFVIVIEWLIILLGIWSYGTSLQGLQAITRFSGRFSLLIFSFIFLFAKNERLNIRTILSDQFYFVFAIAHGIHLLELLSYVYLSNAILIPIRLAGGFLAYVFIFSMPLINYLFTKGTVSQKQFSIAELIYSFYIWLIFFLTYLPRVQGQLPNVGGTYREHVILLGWVGTLLGFKISTFFTYKRKT